MGEAKVTNLKESDSVGLFLGSVSWHVVTFSLFLVEEVLGSLVTGLELSSKAGFSGVSGLLGLLSVRCIGHYLRNADARRDAQLLGRDI